MIIDAKVGCSKKENRQVSNFEFTGDIPLAACVQDVQIHAETSHHPKSAKAEYQQLKKVISTLIILGYKFKMDTSLLFTDR